MEEWVEKLRREAQGRKDRGYSDHYNDLVLAACRRIEELETAVKRLSEPPPEDPQLRLAD